MSFSVLQASYCTDYTFLSRYEKRFTIAIFGAKVWNCLPLEIRRLPRTAFKQKIRDLLFRIFDAEDNYVDSPTLLNKIVKQ